MATGIRIGVLSIAAAVYLTWAFRGIEYDLVETGPPLLELIAALLIPTLIAVPIYRRIGQPDAARVSRFSILFWAVSAGLVAAVWLVLFTSDAAAAGFFRDNVVIGIVGLVAVVAVINFGVLRAIDYFGPTRR